jgi:hypothetical protein
LPTRVARTSKTLVDGIDAWGLLTGENDSRSVSKRQFRNAPPTLCQFCQLYSCSPIFTYFVSARGLSFAPEHLICSELCFSVHQSWRAATPGRRLLVCDRRCVLRLAIRSAVLTVEAADQAKARLESLRFPMTFNSFGELRHRSASFLHRPRHRLSWQLPTGMYAIKDRR